MRCVHYEVTGLTALNSKLAKISCHVLVIIVVTVFVVLLNRFVTLHCRVAFITVVDKKDLLLLLYTCDIKPVKMILGRDGREL